jgi:cobalt-zinc-cadmium efflux system membrane fusion protein
MNGDHTTSVFSQFSGTVTRVIANPGDHVHKGDPLLAVSATEFVQEHDDLVAARAGLNSAQAQLKQAEVTAKRKQDLFDISAGSMQDVQQSQADLAVARNAVGTAQAALSSARGKLRILGKSEAEIDRLQADERIDSQALIKAPIDGVVIDRQVGLGQYLQADPNNHLFTISDLSSVWLVASVREADAAEVVPGALVRVTVPAYPGRAFNARVTYVSSVVDPATRRLAVRATIRNSDEALKPEMYASFTIENGPTVESVAVPEKAVLYEGEDTHVWVVDDHNAMTLRVIHVGRSSDGMLEVLDGLAAGERVVTSGSIFIDRASQSD